MKETSISDIQACEEQLQQAMIDSDIARLDELLSADLVFTNHLGYVMTKQDDIDAHASGKLTIESIEPADYRFRLYDDTAIVNVKVRIAGSYEGASSTQDFRFTRVWKRVSEDAFQVVAGHSCVVA